MLMGNQFIFEAMQEEDWASGVLDGVDVTESFIDQGSDEEAHFTKKTPGYILNRSI
jgi:hypothetical protein